MSLTKSFRCLVASVVVVALGLGGCGRSKESSAGAAEGSVFLKIHPVPGPSMDDKDARSWIATYEVGGKAARFRIALALKRETGGRMDMFTTGTLSRERDSDPEFLLRDLGKALEAPGVVPSKEKVDTLPVAAAILGENLSRGKGEDSYAGSFTSTPKGSWIALKIFVADGEGEFYLNLNPVDGVGEIALKDPEYGSVVMRELSKVLH